MRLKSLLQKMTAFGIASIMAFQNPIQAFAAAKPVYISNMLVSYAKSNSKEDIAAAKKWLADQGYKVLEQNLNENTDNTFSKNRPVFLGYQTTANPEDAITDMRVMNMNADYSFDSYEKLLSAQKDEIEMFLDNVMTALQEYRENFSYVQDILDSHGATYEEIGTVLAEFPDEFDGSCYRAMIAYENLNLLYDDDTGYPMGELLLEPIKEENPGEDGNAHADMTTIMLQANSVSVLAIMQNLSYAADDTGNGETWLTRAEQSDGLEGLMERYEEENPSVPHSRIQQLMKVDFDSDAGLLSEKISALQEYVAFYTNSGIALDTEPEKIEQYFSSHPDEDFSIWLNAGAIYDALQEINVSGVPLSELLLSGNYNFSQQGDRAELYPLLDAMTAGQRSLLTYVSLDRFLINALNDDDSWADAYGSNHEHTAGVEATSLYIGVDRDMFNENGGTALTRTAADHEVATGESHMEHCDLDTMFYWTKILGITAVTAAVAGAACLITSAHYAKESIHIRSSLDISTTLDNLEDTTNDLAETNSLAQKKYGIANRWLWAGRVICIAAALIAITSAVLLLVNYFQSTNVDYSKIPLYMVHGKEQELKEWENNASWLYIYYSAVRCNRISGGFLSDNTRELSDCGDLNGDVGREWVALYTTKDKNLGQPILASSLVVSSSEKIPFGKRALSYFGEEYAANLSNPDYVFNSNAPAHYIFFSNAESASAVGTVTSSGILAMTVGLTVLAGGAIGYLLSGKIGKKKKDEVKPA